MLFGGSFLLSMGDCPWIRVFKMLLAASVAAVPA